MKMRQELFHEWILLFCVHSGVSGGSACFQTRQSSEENIGVKVGDQNWEKAYVLYNFAMEKKERYGETKSEEQMLGHGNLCGGEQEETMLGGRV